MKASRWLLPFTHGVDMQALEAAIRLAESGGATLVAVSLIAVPGRFPEKGARLEHIQQSKDFLESVYHKANRRRVALERYEVFTPEVIERITALTYELRCDAIILADHNRRPSLLHAQQIKQLLADPPAPLLFIRLAPQSARLPAWRPGAWLAAWLRQRWPARHDDAAALESAPGDDPGAERKGGDTHARSAHLTAGGR